MLLKNLIKQQFSAAIEKSFGYFPDMQALVDVSLSTQAKFGHYQCNSAMKLTKILKQPPRQIAEKIVEAWPEDGVKLAKIEIAGPGFINITLSNQFVTDLCEKMRAVNLGLDLEYKGKKVIVDYSCPNTAKEMHVGHLRSTIIGESIARLFEMFGANVLRLNHIGDWGTSFGMLIAYIKQNEPQIIKDPNSADLSFLVQCYKKAKQKFDQDAVFKRDSQLEVVALQGGNEDSLKVWQQIAQISRKAYQEIYNLLDIDQLQERGESFYNPYLNEIIDDLTNKNLLKESDGAQCMFLEGFENRQGESLPLMLKKSDGGFNYATTDLAAVRHRVKDEKADRIIYVTDGGQAQHFAMVFKAAEKAGYVDPAKVQINHVPFGLVLGPDGKKFKTRSGETERLIDLLTAAVDKSKAILSERQSEREDKLATEEIETIAKHLGINAVKYADLSCNRVQDYMFSYDKMLKFEGNTAAFLMYSYVRINGIKRKASAKSIESIGSAKLALSHSSEIELGLHLLQFNDVLLSITDDLLPSRLCDYLYELANKFNAFFRDCKVIGDEQEVPRLALCEVVANLLKQGMHILGLQIVDRM